MDKIVFLKILIGIITFLIFLTLGGIVYGLINYKTTPKLLSRKASPTIQQQIEEYGKKNIPETSLELKKGEKISGSHACGDMLCLQIQSDFDENKIIIFDINALQIKAVLVAGQKKSTK